MPGYIINQVSAFPLLSTKLSLPPRRPSLVSRPRLLDLLDLGLQPGSRLTVLSAPAGFGKTSLVIDWAGALAEREDFPGLAFPGRGG